MSNLKTIGIDLKVFPVGSTCFGKSISHATKCPFLEFKGVLPFCRHKKKMITLVEEITETGLRRKIVKKICGINE